MSLHEVTLKSRLGTISTPIVRVLPENSRQKATTQTKSRLIAHEDQRNLLVHLVQEFKCFRSLQRGVRVLGQNDVIVSGLQALGKLTAGRNDFRLDPELRIPELYQAAPRVRYVAVNKENAEKRPSKGHFDSGG
jgi:hypothetical protein